MATLNELIYNIRGIIKERSDDSNLSNSQIAHMINYCRETLIRRDYENKHSINPQIEQPLGCWDVIPVDKAECCELSTDCNILRTSLPLPQFVETYKKILLTYVGSIDDETDYQIISPVRSRWTKYDKYTSQLPKAIIKNGYLYITGYKYLDKIKMRGVLSDPRVAKNYYNCSTGGTCFNPLTDTYPMAAWMEQAMVKMLREGELDIYFKSLQDKTNDNDDSKEPNTKAQ